MKAVDLADALEERFSAHSLQTVADSCQRCDEFRSSPALMLLVSFVCSHVADYWESAVTTAHSEQLSGSFGVLIPRCLREIAGDSQERAVELADELARLVVFPRPEVD